MVLDVIRYTSNCHRIKSKRVCHFANAIYFDPIFTSYEMKRGFDGIIERRQRLSCTETALNCHGQHDHWWSEPLSKVAYVGSVICVGRALKLEGH
jgi:hypothetical protein